MERYVHTGFVNNEKKVDKDLAGLPAVYYGKGILTALSEQEKEYVMKTYLILNKKVVGEETVHLSERRTEVVTPNTAMSNDLKKVMFIFIKPYYREHYRSSHPPMEKSVPSGKEHEESQFGPSKTTPFSSNKDKGEFIESQERPAAEVKSPDLPQSEKLKGEFDITCITEGKHEFINNKPPIFKESSTEIKTEIEEDINYQAFLRDEESLKREFAGYMVAYADGKKVSIGRNVDELLAGLEPNYTNCPLFIKTISSKSVKFRRPMHMPRW
jgi:hypothetical protein